VSFLLNTKNSKNISLGVLFLCKNKTKDIISILMILKPFERKAIKNERRELLKISNNRFRHFLNITRMENNVYS